jgi:hypothetical protein
MQSVKGKVKSWRDLKLAQMLVLLLLCAAVQNMTAEAPVLGQSALGNCTHVLEHGLPQASVILLKGIP